MKSIHARCLWTKWNDVGCYAGSSLLLMLVLNVTTGVDKPVAQVIRIIVFEVRTVG